ncbi:MAG: glycoside hydrolase family 43 protein [Cyclobacteriaceae bacterium]|nr:glycoside hydrolase family 43 protein [Cyclobacteriaceae bacterium]MDH5249995.1 glycoside hydrolase family 43 protein [Cyclobacteriaceae bacterium]
MNRIFTSIMVLGIPVLLGSCQKKDSETQANDTETQEQETKPIPISEPLITHIYTADPSAHVFDGRIYIYPSHDIESNVPQDDEGGHFDMKDYHVLSMDSIGGPVTDHGVALDIKDIPWAGRQLWAPDAAYANGTYYLYFPAKDKADVFRIGVATSTSPSGPFKAEPEPIAGSYSMDPAVFKDDDGKYYMYFGGIWGGQLQRWSTGTYAANGSKTDLQKDDAPAIRARMARMSKNMLAFDESVKEIKIVDQDGNELPGKDHDRRFFEASWMHKYNSKYYFSYSTGDTHFICYAIGDNPYGPFTYQGVILNPVVGWTNHHSIVEVKGKWYLFYHDSVLSGGQTHLRTVKVTELTYNPDGSIHTIDAYQKHAPDLPDE